MTWFVDAKYDNFWRLGCCFDTITDYLLASGDVPQPEATIETVLNKYNDLRAKHNQRDLITWWYDDYAWWSIASAKAYDPRYDRIFGSYKGALQDVAKECWIAVEQGLGDRIHLGAPKAYENRENLNGWRYPPHPLEGWYAPLIDGGRGSGLHGTWQYDIFSIKRPNVAGDPHFPEWIGPGEGTDANPSWPVGDKAFWAGPYQLTVMNALYFLMTARLVQARRNDPTAPDAAMPLKDVFGFLWAWFGKDDKNKLPAEVPPLLQPVDGGGQVVCERVSRYARRNGNYDVVYLFEAQNTWGGDIGMVLNALATYNTLNLDADPGPRTELIKQLVLGYIARVYDSTAKVPKPYYPTGGFFDKHYDSADYQCGIGVFMRGLLQAFQQYPVPIRELDLTDFLNNCKAWADKQNPNDPFACMNVLATRTVVNAIG
jgi:hypothetical protein